eukprot:6507661-Prymnesium_polylepis.1
MEGATDKRTPESPHRAGGGKSVRGGSGEVEGEGPGGVRDCAACGEPAWGGQFCGAAGGSSAGALRCEHEV